MPNIAMPAALPAAKPTAGKPPGNGGAAKVNAAGDFRQHPAMLKAAAKTASQIQTENPVTPPDAGDPGKSQLPATAQEVARLLATNPPAAETINMKTTRSSRQESSAKAPTGKPEPGAAPVAVIPVQASFTLPATAKLGNAVLAVTGNTAPTTSSAILTGPIRQKLPADAPAKPTGHTAQAPPVFATDGTQSASTTASTTAAPAIPAPPHHATISGQLAQALPANTAKSGTALTLHVSLTPETLGNITIKIQHNAAGDANVTITASQPETLETLKKDVTNLNQILTSAGVSEASRHVDFRAAPVTASQSGTGLGNAANAFPQGNSSGQQAPQHGTGFANSFKDTSFLDRSLQNAAPAPVRMPVPAAKPGAPGGVDVIA